MPLRKGLKQSPGLVQCTSCECFIPWGLCDCGHAEMGRLEPRVWRRCEDYLESDQTVRCIDCASFKANYCLIAEYPVTGADKEISCQYFNRK